MGEHIEKLTDVFCSKLKVYFMQIGARLPKRNAELFNFEELNIRCFYHRLKEYYKAQGWDSMEGLAKTGNLGARKYKMIQFSSNIIEKQIGKSQKNVGTYVADRKAVVKNQSRKLSSPKTSSRSMKRWSKRKLATTTLRPSLASSR